MVPVKLEITNFMSYQGHHELDFTGFKTASIVGTNGSGKSAILDAITWVLFGKSRITKDAERKDNVRERNDVINCYSSFCQVSLEFELEGKRYFVNRRIDRGKSGQGLQFKLLTDAGEIDLHGKGASDAEIEKELGVSFKVFLTSSFITQGDSSRFMEASPRERREILAEILELDVYERCLEQASEMSKETKKNKEILEDKQKILTEAALLEPDIKRKLELANVELADATRVLESKKIEREKLAAELVTLENQIGTLLDDEKKKIDREKESEKLEKEIAKWQEEISKAQAVIDKSEEIESGYEQFVQSKKELDMLNEKSSAFDKLEKEAILLSSQIKLEENNLQNSLNQKKIEYAESLNATQMLPELGTKLDLARNDQNLFDQAKSEFAEFETSIISVEKDVLLSKTNFDNISKKINTKLISVGFGDIASVEKELSDFEVLNTQLGGMQAEFETNEINLARIKTEIELAKSETAHLADEIKLLEQGETGNCPLCGQALEKSRQTELLEEKTNGKKSLLDKTTVLEQDMKRLSEKVATDKVKITQIKKRIDKKSDLEAISQLSMELNSVTKQLDENKKNLENLKQKKKDFLLGKGGIISRKSQIETNILSSSHNLEDAKKKAEKTESLGIEISSLKEKLDTRDFAKSEQEQLASVEKEKEELGFDVSLLIRAKEQYQIFLVFEDKKKLLDRAKDYVTSATPALAQATDRINSVKIEIVQIDERITNLPSLKTRKSSLDEQLKTCKSNEQILSQDRDAKMTQKNNLERDLEQSQKAKLELDEVSTKLINTDKELKILEECKKMFGTEGIPSQILEGVIPELQEMANSILTDISQGRIGSEGMRLQIETSREGTTKTYKTLGISITDGQIRRPYELFSGGERFRADFAIRIALSQLLAGRSGRRMRTLVIDEGFGTQDDEGIRRLIEAIQDVAERFDKVLVISHVDEIKNAFEKRILVRRNAESSSFELV